VAVAATLVLGACGGSGGSGGFGDRRFGGNGGTPTSTYPGRSSTYGGGGSLGDRIDRIDTSDGIRVTITACEAAKRKTTSDGIPQTVYTASGTVENTTSDARVQVKVHVTFLDGDHEFYATDVDDVFHFGGMHLDEAQRFSESVTLSDHADHLRCEANATS
jgi:hypothetical protein